MLECENKKKGNYRKHCVEQVSYQRSSILHRSFTMFQVSHRVTEGNCYSMFDKFVDCFRRPLLLWRQCNDRDIANVTINLLNRFEALVKVSDAMSWMSAFLVDRNKWTFNVNAQNCCSILSTRFFLNFRQNLMIRFSGRCHECWAKACDTMYQKSFGNFGNSLINGSYIIREINSVPTLTDKKEKTIHE